MSNSEQRYAGEWVGNNVFTWSLVHWNAQPVTRAGAMAAYHEIVVCLSGGLKHAPHTPQNRPPVVVHEGGVIAYNRGDLFDFTYGGDLGSGSVVGFGIPSAEALGIADFNFNKTVLDDPEIAVFAAKFVAAREAGTPLSPQEVEAALKAFVLKHAEPVRIDAIFSVKNEIDRNPAAPLYLAHLAEMANMKPDTFSRAFARRFGLSPIAYRVRRRLLEAGRLLLEAPDMLVSEIAARVGFDDVRNFHRAFRQRTGVSPLEFRLACGVAPRTRRGSGAPPPKLGESTEQVA